VVRLLLLIPLLLTGCVTTAIYVNPQTGEEETCKRGPIGQWDRLDRRIALLTCDWRSHYPCPLRG